MRRLAAALVVVFGAAAVALAAAACGAVTAPFGVLALDDASLPLDAAAVDARGAADGPVSPDAPDADVDVTDAPTDVDAGPACDPLVVLDATPCTIPPEDTFTASPDTISVGLGSYGVASFVLGGPWASAPNFVFHFAGATLPLQTTPYLMTNRPPASFAFLLLSSAPLGPGTFSVTAQLGNMLRTATVTVDVTKCQPWQQSTACGQAQCGYVGDNCGGMVKCGTCPADAPTCYLGQCIAGTPTYCPSGQGLGMDGACTACTTLPVCKDCPVGDLCLGLQDICVCAPYPFPACPAQPPSSGDQCSGIGETCDFAATCGALQCQCGADYLWSCGVECDAGGTGD